MRQLEKEGPLGRPRRRIKDCIRLDLQETGWGTWPGLWDFGTVKMNLPVP